MNKGIFYLFALLVTATLLSASTPRVVTVATVVDAEISEYTVIEEMLKEELKTLTQGTYKINFSKRISAKYSIQKAQDALINLQNDSQTDMILAIGIVSAKAAFKSDILKKPTFAPYHLHIDNQSLTSNKYNLNYLIYNLSFDKALKDFLSVTTFTHLTLLTNSIFSSTFPEVLESLKVNAAKKGIQLNTVIGTSKENDILSIIAPDTKAVMLTPLPALSEQDKEQIFQDLIKKHIPTYALGNDLRVEKGVLISSFSMENQSRRIRQLALNIQAVIRGEDAETLPIKFDEKYQLNINIATANAIGLYPPINILRQAKLFSEENYKKDDLLTLSDVAKQAIKNNLRIIAGKLTVTSEDENIKEIRSILFPQITGNLSYMQQNSDNIYVKNGFYAEKSSSGVIKLHQTIFSEKAMAAVEIQKSMKNAAQAQQRTLELDIIERATTLFLNILIAQTQLAIEKENLNITEVNMELARGRIEAGTSDMSDIYHWESRMSTSRQRVLEAKSTIEKARDALNLILNFPIAQRIKTVPATLDDSALLISHKPLLTLISNENDYRLVNNFFVEEGLKSAPELYLFDSRISAQARKLESDRRAYLLPEIALTGELSHVFEEERSPLSGFNLEGQTNWQAGVVLSLPLFEGGAKDARVSRSQLALRQLKISKQEQKNAIEQQIRNDLHAIRSSYPSIELSNQAADSAKKSFKLVQDNYAEGTCSMTELLIAQNASILAEQSSANAVYKFLIDLMYLQRDIGQFDFFIEDSQRTSLIERLTSLVKPTQDRSLQPIKVSQ